MQVGMKLKLTEMQKHLSSMKNPPSWLKELELGLVILSGLEYQGLCFSNTNLA